MTPGPHGDGCTLGGTTCGSLAGGISEPRRRMAEAPGSPRGWDVKLDVFGGDPYVPGSKLLMLRMVIPPGKIPGMGVGFYRSSRRASHLS